MSVSRRNLLLKAAALFAADIPPILASQNRHWIARDGSIDGGPNSGFVFGTRDGKAQAWTAHNAGMPYSCQVWPSAEQAKILRLELHAGDQWPDESRTGQTVERTMVQAITTPHSGISQALPLAQDIWWGFSFFLDAGSPITALAPGYDWLIFADIHSNWNASHAHAVPIQMEILPGDTLDIQLHGTRLFPANVRNVVYRGSGPISRGTWHDLVLHLVMNPLDALNGVAEAYLDGIQVLRYSGTLGFVGDLPYLQFQIYRNNPDPSRLLHEIVSIQYANHEVVTSGVLEGRITRPPLMPSTKW